MPEKEDLKDVLQTALKALEAEISRLAVRHIYAAKRLASITPTFQQYQKEFNDVDASLSKQNALYASLQSAIDDTEHSPKIDNSLQDIPMEDLLSEDELDEDEDEDVPKLPPLQANSRVTKCIKGPPK